MQIKRRFVGDVAVITVTGHLDANSLPAVREELDHIVEDGGTRICLNCRGLAFIDSTALGRLVATQKNLKEAGGELVVSQPSRFLQAAIRTLELHHIFEVFSSDGEALEHFGSPAA